MTEILKKFERIVVLVLIGLMMVVVTLATIELGWIIIKDIITPPIILLEIEELLEIFGFFLLVLIGVELLPNFSSEQYHPVFWDMAEPLEDWLRSAEAAAGQAAQEPAKPESSP